MRYLSLSREGDKLRGLVAYCHTGGIAGFEALFERGTRLSGVRTRCPVHFPIHADRNEYLSGCWVRRHGSVLNLLLEPAFVVSLTGNT